MLVCKYMKNTCIHLNSFPKKQVTDGVFAGLYSNMGITSQKWQDVASV